MIISALVAPSKEDGCPRNDPSIKYDKKLNFGNTIHNLSISFSLSAATYVNYKNQEKIARIYNIFSRTPKYFNYKQSNGKLLLFFRT